MTLIDHQRLVRRAGLLACWTLAILLAAQVLLRADFHGLPFLAFALILGPPGLSLFVRTIWMRLVAKRP